MLQRGLRFAFLLALGALVTACGSDGKTTLDPRVDAAVTLYRAEGAEKALPEFKRLAQEFGKGANRHNETAALHYVGECHWRLGNFDEARKYLDRALAMARRARDRAAEGKALNVLGLLEWDQGNYDQAQAKFQRAGAIGRDLHDRKLEGSSLNNLGLVNDELGEYDVSLKQYRQVLELYRDTDFPRGVADTLGNIGGVHLLLGHFREGLDYYRQGLVINERLQSKPAMSQDQGNIALCLLGLGEVDSAIEHFDRAIALAQQAGMRQDEAYWILGRGNAQIQKGFYGEGLKSHRAALAIYESIGAQAELSEAMYDLGRLYLLLGDPDSAERQFVQALELSRTIGLSRGITLNLIALGDLQLRRQRFDEASTLFEQARQRSIETAEQQNLTVSLLRLGLTHRQQDRMEIAAAEVNEALTLARKLGARPLEAEALFAQAELERRGGHVKSAIKGFAAAETVLAQTGNPDLGWQIHYGRALALEAQGSKKAAIDSLIAAVTLIESVRGRLREERFRAGYVEDKYQVYTELVRLQLEQGETASAFSTAERLRARSYAEQVGGRLSWLLSVDDQRKETQLRERIRQLQRALSDEEQEGHPAHRERAESAFSRELARAEQAYQVFLDDRAAALPLAGVLGGAGPSATSIQDRLRNDEALLEYVVGSDTLITFVLTSRQVYAKAMPLRRTELHARIALLRDLVRRPGDERWHKPAARLSAVLVEPLDQGRWLEGIQRLYVVSHDALNYLPFALLPRTSTDSTRLLIDDFTIAQLPAATALLRDHPVSKQAQSMLALAPARSRLRFAPEEARSVDALFQPNSQLLLGVDASESQFKKLAAGFRVLHLATHGSFNRLNPLLSGLELEADKTEDGLLQVHEVLGLRLHADLVTLSACETALGSGYFTEVPAGDEFVGLTRAFLAAGGEAVLATLWEVDDRASVGIMTRFYQYMNGSKDADSMAGALARVQREFRSSKEFGHPYFWAPFILVGTEPRVPVIAQLDREILNHERH